VDSRLTLDDCLKHLEQWESWRVHWNKTEEAPTAFYGVYRKAYPNFEGWAFLKHIILREPVTKYNYKLANEILKENPHLFEAYKALAKHFFKKHYYDKLKLNEIEDKKVALSIFSFSVNLGKKRAVEILQRLVGVKDDGIIGPKTIKAINDYNRQFKNLNEVYIDSIKDYYISLATSNPEKYQIYLNGWMNRANSLL